MTAGSVYFSVGEPSGDQHAARLIEQMRHLDPSLQFRGLGGPAMKAAGCGIDFELTQLAVVGLLEVVPKLREFFRVADLAENAMKTARPAAVVLVDFPGFNWHIAARARRLGIPVIYYLPPQLWAWGAWRLKKMQRSVDHVICNLPFEPAWYAERGMQVEYVGHPFFDAVHEQALDTAFMDQIRTTSGLKVAVLPGSRRREVETIWPMQLNAIRQLAKQFPETHFLVAAYKDHQRQACEESLSAEDRRLNLEFFVGKTSEILELCDCALIKSGSVSLELMARGKPTVVTYYSSRSLYAIGRCLTNIQSMTLPNMIAGQRIMPEFLAVGSTRKTTQQVISAMEQLLGDSTARERQSQQLRALAARYAQPGASARAAQSILGYLAKNRRAVA